MGVGPLRAPGVAILLVVAAVLPAFLAAGLAPRIRADFRFTDAQLGLAVAVSYVVAAFASAPAGRLVHRIGPVPAVHLGAALAAASTLGIAAVARSAGGLILLLAVAGLANALSGPAAGTLVTRARRARSGFGLGTQQAGAPAGSLLAGLALPLIAVPLGWRAAFALAALAPLAVALLLGRGAWTGRAAPAQAGRRAEPVDRSVRRLALAAALANSAAVGAMSFLVVFAVSAGLADAQAGLLLAATSLAAGASRVALGALADRRSGDVLAQAAAMLALGALGFALLSLASAPAIVAGALVAGGVGWGWTGLVALGAVRRSPEAPAAALGTFMTGVFVGSAAGPLLLGLLVGAASYTAAWVTCAALALLASGVVLAARGG